MSSPNNGSHLVSSRLRSTSASGMLIIMTDGATASASVAAMFTELSVRVERTRELPDCSTVKKSPRWEERIMR